MKNISKLIFIYNADSGIFNLVSDIAHKIFSPSTYPCSLCDLTHSPLKMKEDWRDFLAGLPMEKAFYHRDDGAAAFPGLSVALPVILYQESSRDTPQELMSAAALNGLPDLDALKTVLSQKLRALAAV